MFMVKKNIVLTVTFPKVKKIEYLLLFLNERIKIITWTYLNFGLYSKFQMLLPTGILI